MRHLTHAMQLVVITSPTSTPHEAVLCNQMCHAGLRRLHLRKPGWKRADASSFLSELDDRTVRSVVLHDWHELVTEFSVKVAPLRTVFCQAVPLPLEHETKLSYRVFTTQKNHDPDHH